jgi:hypothetical protein
MKTIFRNSLGADKDRHGIWRACRILGTRTLVKAFVLMAILLPALNGCASLMDGKFVTKDGKESPFNPLPDRYAPPKDPTARF